MKSMILVDIETTDFGVESGIHEVGLLVVEDGEIVLAKHLAEVEDPSRIHLGMGEGYADISEDEVMKAEFKSVTQQYRYPIVAHNVSFDRKFLVHYEWLDENHECFDSVRAIKYSNPHLFSYSLEYLLSFYEVNRPMTHTAIDDVHALYEVITRANPQVWVPLYKVPPKQFQSFVESINIEGQSNSLQNKRIVFTGASPFPRSLMKAIAEKCGAVVTGGVSSKTDILVCGDSPGSKLQKARELEVEVQTDTWFVDLVSNDLNLESISVVRRNEAFSQIEIKKVPELEGKSVNISCLPANAQSKVEEILLTHLGAGKVNKSPRGYKVDAIIYDDRGDYGILEKAKELSIDTIPLSTFNRIILPDLQPTS